MENAAEDLKIYTIADIKYHSARADFLETINRVMILIVLLLGTSAAANILGLVAADSVASVQVWVGAAIATLTALQLVYDFSGRAANHTAIAHSCADLLEEMEAVEGVDERTLRVWKAKRARLTVNALGTYRVVQAISYNEAVLSVLGGRGGTIPITTTMSLFRHLFKYRGVRLEPLAPPPN